MPEPNVEELANEFEQFLGEQWGKVVLDRAPLEWLQEEKKVSAKDVSIGLANALREELKKRGWTFTPDTITFDPKRV